MINETRFKEELKMSVSKLSQDQIERFTKDFQKTIKFYDESKTGNERAEREKDTVSMKKHINVVLIYTRENAYLTELRRNNSNVWLIAKAMKSSEKSIMDILAERKAN